MPATTRTAVTVGALVGGLITPGHPSLMQPPRDLPSVGASPLWHLEGRGWGTPAADPSTVYFLTAAHELQARHVDTGGLRWSVHTGEPGLTTAGSNVALAGDLVVAGDYNVVAVDRRDGVLRWRFTPTDGYAPGMYLGATNGDLVFAGSPAGRLYAIDHRTGTARWSYALAGGGDRTTMFQPVSEGNLVVSGYTTFAAPNSGGVVALEVATGREHWRTAFPPPPRAGLDAGWAGGPVLTAEVVIATRADGVVVAFDRRTGAVRWTLPTWTSPTLAPGDRQDRDLRPLACTGNLLFVGSLSGEVIAYDLADRSERWRYASPSNGSVAFRMLADQQSVYIPYIDGSLVSIDAASGRERWRTGRSSSGFIWPPAVSGDRVFAADFEAGFFAFPR